MCTDSPRTLFLIDVYPGHFALIARESRRNDCPMKPVECARDAVFELSYIPRRECPKLLYFL